MSSLQTVTILKEYNIRHHYEIKHSLAFSKYRGKARKQKANKPLANLRYKQSALLCPALDQENATQASYQISALIAKSLRAFVTGKFVKECFCSHYKAMCPSQI